MPANLKYLNKSPWQQFAKISAGLLGGYIITAFFHMVLALWLPYPKNVLISFIFTFFIVWSTLLIVPFLFKNGWYVWFLYLLIMLVLFGMYYLGNQNNPFI
ncbi:hypothetical protein [Flavivirga jejuensis]|uniref:Uncharacterized protein n=1 Tax=Flavivirga jejuensis TaxID=870487 RepID=A0ABT8WKN6_9FLAO|nr:hypothetical protein [Flavivirga jejuensis]MDO5973715.1 hypothetical protein [Flavivirga jejuensis]